MPSTDAARHFILTFVPALAGYAVCFLEIEPWRTRKGPWRVTFTHSPARAPVIASLEIPVVRKPFQELDLAGRE